MTQRRVPPETPATILILPVANDTDPTGQAGPKAIPEAVREEGRGPFPALRDCPLRRLGGSPA